MTFGVWHEWGRQIFVGRSAMTEAASRRFRAAGLLLLLAALALSLAGLFLKAPHYDEAISLLVVAGHGHPQWPGEPAAAETLRQIFDNRISFVSLLREVSNVEVHPPLHSIALWMVQGLAGLNIVASRMLSFLAGIGILLCMGWIWRRDSGAGTFGTFAFLLILATAVGFYAQATYGRGYSLATLFLCAGFVGVRRLADLADRPLPASKESVFAAMVGLVCGLAPLTHYLSGFVAPVVALTGMVLLLRLRRLGAAAILGAAALLPAIAAGYFAITQHNSGYYHWAFNSGLIELFLHQLQNMLLYEDPEIPVSGQVLAIVLGGIILTLVALVGAVTRYRRMTGQFWIVVYPALLVGVHLSGIIGLSLYMNQGLISARFTALIWPFIAMLKAAGILWLARSDRASWRMALPALLIVVQASILTAMLVDRSVGPWRRGDDIPASSRGSALLIVDLGFGRGTPGAVVLSAHPETRIWVVGMERLGQEGAIDIASSYKELHVALSPRTVSDENYDIETLPKFPLFRSYAEQQTENPYHRYFIWTAGD